MKRRLFAGLVVTALLLFAFPLLNDPNTRADAAVLELNTGDALHIALAEDGTYRATLSGARKDVSVSGNCEKELRLVRAENAGDARSLTVEAEGGGAGALTLRLDGVGFSEGIRIGTRSSAQTKVNLILQTGTVNTAVGAPGQAGVAVGEDASLCVLLDETGKGALNAAGASGGAGLGGDAGRACGIIRIFGGRITARGNGGGAGVGGGAGASGGALCIAGGTVWASSDGGASIGNGLGGGAASSSNYVQITGGSVHAENGIAPAPRTGAGADGGDAAAPVLLAVTGLTGAVEGACVDALKLGSSVDAEGRSAYGADDLFTALLDGDAVLCAYLPVMRCAGFVKAGGDWRQLWITHQSGVLSGRVSENDGAEIDAGYDNVYFAEDAGGAPCMRYGGREFSASDAAYGKVTQTPFFEDGNRHAVSNRRILALGGAHTITVIDSDLSDSVRGLSLASKRAGVDVRAGAVNLVISDTLTLLARNTSADASASHAGIRVEKNATLRLYCATAWNNGSPVHNHVCQDACASVLAAGGAGGAGIGVAAGGDGAFELHGCRIIANGGAGGAGIGGGVGASCGTVRVLGGRAVAAGGGKAAGLGAGADALCGVLELSGGSVVATGGAGAAAGLGDAATGGGASSEERYICITGGSVYSADGVLLPQPRSAAGAGGVPVYKVALSFSGVAAATRVRAVELDSLSYSYSMRCAATDEAGRVYVYLPAEMCVTGGVLRPPVGGEARYYPAQGGEIRACAGANASGTLYTPLAGKANVSGQGFVGGTLTGDYAAAEAGVAPYYAWYRMDSDAGTLVQAPSQTGASYSPTQLDLGYKLKLRISAEGFGYYVDSAETQPVFTVPGAPKVTEVKASGAGSLTVRWEAPVVSGGGAITAYNVYRNDSLITTVALSSAARSYTDPGCTAGGSYAYSVSAINAAGEGARSAQLSREMARAPSAPRNVTASAGQGDGSVRVTWDAPESSGGADVRLYRVLSRLTGSTGAFAALEVPAIAGQLAYSGVLQSGALLNGASYEFRVEAVNLAGGTRSEAATAMPYVDPAITLGEDKSLTAGFRYGDGENAVACDTLQLTTAVGTIARTFPYGAFRISDNEGLSYSMAGVRVCGITSIHQGEVLLSVELAKFVSASEGYLWYEYALGDGTLRRLRVGTVYFETSVEEPDTDAAISSYVFAAPDAAGVISGDVIRVIVPADTDVTALTPVISCASSYARCRPRAGTTLDYTAPVTYTVTAQDGTTRRYTVYVEKARTALTLSCAELDFGSLASGYAAPAAAIVTAHNAGNLRTGVALSGNSIFIVNALTSGTLAPLGDARFTVRPPEGLAVGMYEETLTLLGDGGASATMIVRFTVTDAAENAQLASPAGIVPLSNPNGAGRSNAAAQNSVNEAAPEENTDGEAIPAVLLTLMGVTTAALVPIAALRAGKGKWLRALLRRAARR